MVNEGFTKILYKDEEYFLEVDDEYIKKLHEFHNELPFFPGRMKFGEVEKLVSSLHDLSETVIHII